jgi:dihydroorotate dehydrogenase
MGEPAIMSQKHVLMDRAARALHVLEPEAAHDASLKMLNLAHRLPGAFNWLFPQNGPIDPMLATQIGGLALPHPIGLAAGYDKNAAAPLALARLGFAFVEIGTVTPLPQPGNDKPRLFRLHEDRAVINRFGFNSEGAEAVAARLSDLPSWRPIIGVNVGANKESKDRAEDYVTGLKRFWKLGDYFTVNISSPNTPGLRDLQSRGALDDLLGRIEEARASLVGAGTSKPVLLKVAPDLDDMAIEDISAAARETGMSAIIVSNTTTGRPASLRSPGKGETGGLSGAPLFSLSTHALKLFREATRGRMPLIGVGGVESAETAYTKIRNGACAVQLYSALVYEGPGLVRRIVEALPALLKADGFQTVDEAVGVDVRH